MVNKIASIRESELLQKYKCLIREYYKETGEYPREIHLIAAGHSQLQAVKYEMKKRVY